MFAFVVSGLMWLLASRNHYDAPETLLVMLYSFVGTLAALQLMINRDWFLDYLRPPQNRKGLLTFDGRTLPPEGWRVREGNPIFSRERIDGRYVMRIEHLENGHVLDFDYSTPLLDHKTVAFRVRELQPGARLYVQIEGGVNDGELWFQVNWYDPKEAANQIYPGEWLIPIVGRPEGNWTVYSLDVPAWFSKTFATIGKTHRGIKGFRIRGALVIADICCE